MIKREHQSRQGFELFFKAFSEEKNKTFKAEFQFLNPHKLLQYASLLVLTGACQLK